MTFLDAIFANLEARSNEIVVREIRDGQFVSVTGQELLSLVGRARQFISGLGLKKGDRCALLAPNSIRWIALDLALVSDGTIVVPLYTRQSPAELAAMIQDADPRVLIASDAALADEIRKILPVDIPCVPLDQVFAHSDSASAVSSTLADSDPVTIVYTSGTSGQAKGVVLNAGNVTHILKCTNQRLDLLMSGHSGPENVVSLHSALLCRFLDRDAHLSFAQLRGYAIDGPGKAFRGVEASFAALFSQCADAARKSSREN